MEWYYVWWPWLTYNRVADRFVSSSWVSCMYSYYLHQGGYVFAFVCLSVGRISQPAVDEFWIILEGWDVYVRVCVTIQIRDIFLTEFFLSWDQLPWRRFAFFRCFRYLLLATFYTFGVLSCFFLVLQLRWCALDSPINQSVNQSIKQTMHLFQERTHTTHTDRTGRHKTEHTVHILYTQIIYTSLFTIEMVAQFI